MRQLSKIAILLVLMLSVIIANAQDSQAIDYDEVVSGELDEQTYEQFYTFEGEEGDTIIIRMSATSDSLDSFLYLRDADGNQLAFDDDTAGNLNSLIGPYTLEADGTYTIVATRFQQANGTSIGTYELTVLLAESEAIVLGDVQEIELDDVNSVSILTFVAEESGVYQLDYALLSGNGSAEVSVRNQDGNYLTGVNVDEYNLSNFAVFRLEEGATISLFARYYESYEASEDNGVVVELSFDLAETVALDVDLEQAADISGELDDASSVDYYTFTANNGETIEILGDAPNGGEFEIYVVLPAGYSSFYGSTEYGENDSLVVPQIINQTGEFILVVHRAGVYESSQADDEPLAYDISLILSSTPELIAGEAVEGMIDNNSQVYEDAYIYNGSEGETITITLSSLDDNYQISFSIGLESDDTFNDPNGGFFANFNSSAQGTFSYEVTLPRDGAYIVRIYDGGYAPSPEVGSYSLLIESD